LALRFSLGERYVTSDYYAQKQSRAYDVPEAELARYESLEAKLTPYDEGKDGLPEGEEIAGGVEFDQKDVHARSTRILRVKFTGETPVPPLPLMME
jgi:hypothetical protein